MAFDDHFGSHHYGVKFDGEEKAYDPRKVEIETEEWPTKEAMEEDWANSTAVVGKILLSELPKALPPKKMTQNNFKLYFEANLLDGYDTHDCGDAMISAKECFEVIDPFHRQEIQRAKAEMLKEIIEDIGNDDTLRWLYCFELEGLFKEKYPDLISTAGDGEATK